MPDIRPAPAEAALDLASRYLDVVAMPWQETDFPGIACKVLWRDPESGRSTILFRLAPGAVVPPHFHEGIEQTYMLEGSLEDDEGACTAGNYVWRPPGSRHMAHSPRGGLFLSMFDRPNRFDDPVTWYADQDR